jgi:hypothetical protein
VVLRDGLEAMEKTFCTYRSGDGNKNIQVVAEFEVERFPDSPGNITRRLLERSK